MNKRVIKAIIVAFVFVYAVAADPFIGPIDDLMVAAIGYLVNRNLSERQTG